MWKPIYNEIFISATLHKLCKMTDIDRRVNTVILNTYKTSMFQLASTNRRYYLMSLTMFTAQKKLKQIQGPKILTTNGDNQINNP